MLVAITLCGLLAILFAGIMFFSKSLYISAVCLLGILLQTSIIFILLGAALLGFLQLMIYAGAVMVLVVITIMATGGMPGQDFKLYSNFSFPSSIAVVGFLLSIALISLILMLGQGFMTEPVSFPRIDHSVEFSTLLFRSYAPATEALTLLLFLAALAVMEKEKA